MIRRLLVSLFIVVGCTAAHAQFYTDCTGIAGTSLSGTVVCPSLPAGVSTQFDPLHNSPVPHTFPVQGQAPGTTAGTCLAAAHCYFVTAGSGSSVVTQLTAAAADCSSHGAWIVVPSGNSYTPPGGIGSAFILGPTNCDATHWVIIQSDKLALLPMGTRVSASSTNMPTMLSSDEITAVFIAFDNPATPLAAVGAACTATGGGASTVPCGWWLAGLEITEPADAPLTGNQHFDLLTFGDGCSAAIGGCPITSSMTSKNLASRFTVDRCYVHSHSDNSNIRHGIRFTASYMALEDSILYGLHANGSQATGISSDYSWGPVDIGNTEIAASSEGMIWGGTDPPIPGSVTSDIYVHGNYIHKPRAWFSEWIEQSDTRNLVECKNCVRMLVEGNVFDNDIGRSQSAAIQLTVRNGNGTCTWCTITDVVFRYNKMTLVTDFVSILSANGASSGGSLGPDLPAKRINFHDNVVEQIDDTMGTSFNFTNVTVSGGNATYTYNGHTGNDPVVGINTFVVSGFTNAGNNGDFTITAASPSGTSGTITVATTTQVTETNAATGVISYGNGRIIQLNGGSASSTSCSGTPNTAQCELSDIVFTHNTFAGNDGVGKGITAAFVIAGSIVNPGDKGYNIVVADNIMPSGSYFVSDDDGITATPFSNIMSHYYTSYLFDQNVIPGLVPTGYVPGNFTSPTCNFSATAGCTGPNAAGWQTAMTGVGFVNYNGGIGGDYHLCFASGTPAGCSAASPYVSLSTDGLQTTSQWNNLSPGADVDAINQMTACSVAGLCTIPSARVTGKYTGEIAENFYRLQFPGYFDARIGDGGGPITGGVYNVAATFSSGFGYRYCDLAHDPGCHLDIGGWDAGMFGGDLISTNNACGTTGTDQKAFVGFLNLLYSNNVRSGFRLDWDYTNGSDSSLTVANPNLKMHTDWIAYRPGKIAERFHFDNSCGSTVTFAWAPTLNNHWHSFTHYPPAHAPHANLSTYPPKYPAQWDDDFWQGNTCIHVTTGDGGQTTVTLTGVTVGTSAVYSYSSLGNVAIGVNEVIFVDGFTNAGNNGEFTITAFDSVGQTITVAKTTQVNETHAGTITVWKGYQPCTPSPWRAVNFVSPINGYIMHSAVAGEGCPGTQGNCGAGGFLKGYTPGSTANFDGSVTYPISAETLLLVDENFASTPADGSYACLASVGCRTKIDVGTVSLPSNGADSYKLHLLGWIGALGINNTAGANARQAEYTSPPSPTMNAGTSPTFNYDRADWSMVADATPKVDFTTTGTMYDPTFCISGWNSSIPSVSVNGVAQVENINYVQVSSPGGGDPCSGLLLQFVNSPNIGNSGDVAIPSSSRIVITAGVLPPSGGGSQKGGVGSSSGLTKIGGGN